jgi:hypothetical protein
MIWKCITSCSPPAHRTQRIWPGRPSGELTVKTVLWAFSPSEPCVSGVCRPATRSSSATRASTSANTFSRSASRTRVPSSFRMAMRLCGAGSDTSFSVRSAEAIECDPARVCLAWHSRGSLVACSAERGGADLSSPNLRRGLPLTVFCPGRCAAKGTTLTPISFGQYAFCAQRAITGGEDVAAVLVLALHDHVGLLRYAIRRRRSGSAPRLTGANALRAIQQREALA